MSVMLIWEMLISVFSCCLFPLLSPLKLMDKTPCFITLEEVCGRNKKDLSGRQLQLPDFVSLRPNAGLETAPSTSNTEEEQGRLCPGGPED